MDSIHVAVNEPTDVSEARRVIRSLASRLGLTDVESGQAAIIASEVASNLVKHAGGGQIVTRSLSRALSTGIEILALDKGPGIPDVAACLADGFSSSGTSGTGLGAIRRMSSTFQMYSRPENGTALVARLWSGRVPAAGSRSFFAAGGVSMPHPDEQTVGDSWSVVSDVSWCSVLVADGLGHGPQAAAGACAAVKLFEEHPFAAPTEVLRMAHDALRSTRGAAVAVARIDGPRGPVHFAGVGNITGVLLGPEQPPRNMVALNGIVGHRVARIAGFEYAWPAEGLLLMYSDGLSTHWSLDNYPGLLACDPALIAGVLCRDFRRHHDDVTVVAIKGHSGITPEGQAGDEYKPL